MYSAEKASSGPPPDTGKVIRFAVAAIIGIIILALAGNQAVELLMNVTEFDKIFTQPLYYSLISGIALAAIALVRVNIVQVAQQLSELSQLNSKPITYVECNAISPNTTQFIEKSFMKKAFKNSKYIDGSIIGTAPNDTYKPNLYISGKYANDIESLKSQAFKIINLGRNLEAASSIKMCYASLTKGTNALWISLLLLSEKLNIFNELIEEFDYSQKESLIKMKNQIPKLPSKSGRWIAEMREIASTYKSQSLHSGSFDNSSYIYNLLSMTMKKIFYFRSYKLVFTQSIFVK